MLKEKIEVVKENIKNNFEDENYRMLLDAIQLRKLNKKLRKLQNKLNKLQEKLEINREKGE